MKLRPSVKICLGAIALVATAWGGWQGFAEMTLRSVSLAPLTPGRVNLVVLRPESGYTILVANRVAQVAEASEDSFGNPGGGSDGSSEGPRKRLPIRDLLNALRGDQDGLNKLVFALNQSGENVGLPPDPRIWTSEEIEMAAAGDLALRQRLETDLNVRLDGTPLEQIDPGALEVGIVVDFPVKLNLGGGRARVARMQQEFRPQFAARVMDQVREKDFTPQDLKGYYILEARRIVSGERRREDVLKSLRARFDEGRTRHLAEAPERVLRNTFVLLNDRFFTGSSLTSYDTPNAGRLFDLSLRVTEEGRRRLWKYSRQNSGFQLLFLVNDVAIAAPRIRGELLSNDVRMSQLTDEDLAKEANDTIQSLGNKS